MAFCKVRFPVENCVDTNIERLVQIRHVIQRGIRRVQHDELCREAEFRELEHFVRRRLSPDVETATARLVVRVHEELERQDERVSSRSLPF